MLQLVLLVLLTALDVMTQTPIAERTLTVDGDPGRTVVVTIYAPTPDPSSGWRCEFEIHGAWSARERGRGLDSFQAMVNAIQGVRKFLDDSGMSFSWEGGEPGDHGVPRVILNIFGLRLTRELEDEVQRRLEAHRPPWAPPPDSQDEP